MNAASLIDHRLARLPIGLALHWPGGRAGDSAPAVKLILHHHRLLAALARGQIGSLADAYVRGDLDIEGAMVDVMAVAAALVGDPVRDGPRRGSGRWWAQGLSRWRSRLRHLPGRDAEQVQFHYDLSEDFFGLWLDPLRVYSCAYFSEPELTLDRAQEAKLDLVCRKLQLAPGQRFLDIGAGWGALLLWAARHYGVRATGITLSRNQFEHVNRLIDAAGLTGRVDCRLADYRQLRAANEAEQFDRIASVGMFEHVGEAQMGTYFQRLHSLLRPGGLLLNHAIAAAGLDHAELGAGMGNFIEKHIFPGGELVHVTHAIEALSRQGLELLDAENLRPHYARTLWAWSDALEANLGSAQALAGEARLRAYRLYLAGSAMCFERGWLSLYQLLAARESAADPGERNWAARSDYPFTRWHLLKPSAGSTH